MPVYMVYVCHSVSDRAQLEQYWGSIAPTLKGHSVKYLAAYTPFEVLEGENVEGVFVAEWPSMDAAKAWYDMVHKKPHLGDKRRRRLGTQRLFQGKMTLLVMRS